MDENKFDTELGNAEENVEQEAQHEEASLEEAALETAEAETSAENTFADTVCEAEEKVENDSAEETEENAEEESESNSDEESEENTDEMTEASEDEATQAKPKKKKKGLIALLVILIVIILAALAMIGIVLTSGVSVDVEKTVLTVDDVDSDAGEFINVYGAYSYYASYYGFTEDQIKEYTIDELVAVNSYYSKAIKEEYTLTEDELAEIETNITSLETAAESYGMTTEEYLEEYICKGYTLDMYREYLKKQYLAQKYYGDKIAEIEDQYASEESADAVQAKYDADRTLYDLSDVSYWYFDSTEDDAQTQADAVVSKVNGGMGFEEAVRAVTGDSEAVPNSLAGYSESVIESNFSSTAAEWIFEIADNEYVNGTGSVTTLEENSVIYVLYVNNAPTKDEAVPVTVNYIRIDVSTDTAVKTDAELKLAAKATATSILGEFESGDITADAFASLRDTYDSNDDELVYGDVYEEMVADGSHDEAVESWAFDSARKVGDYALVEGDGCYYILYFTAVNEHPVWYQTALESLIEDAYNEWDAEITAEFEDKTVTYDDAIEEVIAYLTASAS